MDQALCSSLIRKESICRFFIRRWVSCGKVESISPQVADALCRAYNTWAFEITASQKTQIVSRRSHFICVITQLAVKELQRVATLGCKTIFVAAMPVNGHSFGHPRSWTRCGRRSRI